MQQQHTEIHARARRIALLREGRTALLIRRSVSSRFHDAVGSQDADGCLHCNSARHGEETEAMKEAGAAGKERRRGVGKSVWPPC